MSAALPDEAVGALTIGPTVLPIPRDARMQAISFNAAGTPVWELDGSAVDATRMVAWERGFAIGTGKAVVAVSPSTKVDFPVNENMVGGATTNKQSGSFIFWYNSGTPPGTSAEYRNNYIISDRALHSHKNFIPGYMFTAAMCKESTYGAVSP